MTSNQPKYNKKIQKLIGGRSDTIVVSDSDFKTKNRRTKNFKQRNPLVVVAPPKGPSSSSVTHTIGAPKEIIYKF